MRKAELISEVAGRAGLTLDQAAGAIKALTGCVTDEARAGREVRISGFGAFVPVERPAGLVRNPKTGAQVQRAITRTVRFRPGEALKNALN